MASLLCCKTSYMYAFFFLRRIFYSCSQMHCMRNLTKQRIEGFSSIIISLDPSGENLPDWITRCRIQVIPSSDVYTTLQHTHSIQTVYYIEHVIYRWSSLLTNKWNCYEIIFFETIQTVYLKIIFLGRILNSANA